MQKFKPFDAIYCINLKHRKDRKEKTRKVLNKLGIKNVTWFNAIYGKDLNLSKIPNSVVSPSAKSKLTKNEIGCALSHVSIWKDMIKKGYKTVLILEDDIIAKTDMYEILKRSWKSLPKNWDILYLGTFDFRPFNKTSINKYFNFPGKPLGTHAYSINNKSVKNLLERSLPIDRPIDEILASLSKGSEHSEGLKVISYNKNIFDQELNGSDIRNERSVRIVSGWIPWILMIIISFILIYLVRSRLKNR